MISAFGRPSRPSQSGAGPGGNRRESAGRRGEAQTFFARLTSI